MHERDHNTNNRDVLINLQNHSVLGESEKLNLEGEITEEEVSFILKKMKNDQSPGSGGFRQLF